MSGLIMDTWDWQHSGSTYVSGSQASSDGAETGLGARVLKCVHVNVHLHLILQNLHQLLHGGQVT